jgi:hypothetical protein
MLVLYGANFYGLSLGSPSDSSPGTSLGASLANDWLNRGCLSLLSPWDGRIWLESTLTFLEAVGLMPLILLRPPWLDLRLSAFQAKARSTFWCSKFVCENGRFMCPYTSGSLFFFLLDRKPPVNLRMKWEGVFVSSWPSLPVGDRVPERQSLSPELADCLRPPIRHLAVIAMVAVVQN